MTASRNTVRIVRGLRLISTHPGFWTLESNPQALFQKMLGSATLGPRNGRYSVERWLYPGWRSGDATAMSLDAAVKRYLAIAGMPKL